MAGGGQLDPLSDEAVAQTRTHPHMRAAAEAMAANALASYEAQDAATRWLMSDLGRSSLYWGVVILDALPGGVTAAGLIENALASGVASRGRAIAFLQYAQGRGLLIDAGGVLPWSRRRLVPTPAFFAPMRRMIHGVIEAAAFVAPEAADALPRLQSDAGVQAAVAATVAIFRANPQIAENPGGPLRQIFIARDGGMRILQQLMVSQPPGRRRLLEAAPLSRADLARRHRVSRTHIARLLADAQAAGAVRLDAPDRVVFAPAFSDEVEAYYAGQVQLMRMVAATLVAAPGLSAA